MTCPTEYPDEITFVSTSTPASTALCFIFPNQVSAVSTDCFENSGDVGAVALEGITCTVINLAPCSFAMAMASSAALSESSDSRLVLLVFLNTENSNETFKLAHNQ